METTTPSVNLLKRKGNGFGDKFIKWALTIGRMLIILTETIALVAFLYRFILDREIIDQRDRITQKAARLKLYEKSEKDFRNLQERLHVSKTINPQASETIAIFTDILKLAPPAINFNTMTINGSVLHIDANVQSVNTLTEFVNELKKYTKITSVSIDKIENKTMEATIIVGITAKLDIIPIVTLDKPAR